MASFGPHHVTVTARLGGPGWLVMTEAYYPGWSASVDECDTPIALAYGLFRAVPLEAGRHRVEFRYRPQSLRRGAMLSLVGCITAACFVVLGTRRRA